MEVRNIHERFLPVPPERLAPLLDSLASREDGLWPHERWPRMRFDRPLAVGASGGHGPIRYDVEGYEPGRRVRFRFRAPRGFDGWHALVVEPAEGGVLLRHELEMAARGPARLSWPVVFRPLHDALVEDALDKAELAVTGRVARPARWGWRVRVLRAALARQGRGRSSGRPSP
ncbi:SRPBCC family protein [Pyxidicoccus fallax]|uniref:SRPBCC family protein n=1 Tax=Pyxidicoccus fallax TaxID=394095 RepID=A0A848LSM3_9BACT|nr:SRPBCC family protein [Pyxidicoccus fallax]NMO20766.1 SRPBCC family protein [Pyxidicoccus fallax]NPC81613.1 SRPBCC family protein [Pyxidicoccus fallax]